MLLETMRLALLVKLALKGPFADEKLPNAPHNLPKPQPLLLPSNKSFRAAADLGRLSVDCSFQADLVLCSPALDLSPQLDLRAQHEGEVQLETSHGACSAACRH